MERKSLTIIRYPAANLVEGGDHNQLNGIVYRNICTNAVLLTPGWMSFYLAKANFSSQAVAS